MQTPVNANTNANANANAQPILPQQQQPIAAAIPTNQLPPPVPPPLPPPLPPLAVAVPVLASQLVIANDGATAEASQLVSKSNGEAKHALEIPTPKRSRNGKWCTAYGNANAERILTAAVVCRGSNSNGEISRHPILRARRYGRSRALPRANYATMFVTRVCEWNSGWISARARDGKRRRTGVRVDSRSDDPHRHIQTWYVK